MLVVEGDHRIAGAGFFVRQRFQAAGAETAVRMRRIQRLLQNIKLFAAVVTQFGLIFRVHGVLFPLYIGFGKQRGDKELGKTVQARFQVIAVHFKEVVGVPVGGKGVVAAAVFADKALVFSGFRIFFRAQKQHMLQKVGQAGKVFRVLAAAGGDVHGGGGFVCFRVRNQNDVQSVVQRQGSVAAQVVLTDDQRLC